MVFDTFTAANTANGFFSYFNEFISDKSLNHVYLIKGGPGTGKSTFMKKIATAFAEKGATVERIFCSSDKDSLDGIKVYEKGIAVIDATPPHAFDMKYAGARESIIDLSKFWNEQLLTENKNDIILLTDRISEKYQGVYKLLKIAGNINEWRTKIIDSNLDNDKITMHIKKVIKQNAIAPLKSRPTVTNRFVSAIGQNGAYNNNHTIDRLCDEYILFDDKIEIGHIMLTKIHLCFNRLGYDSILFHSPILPETRLEHIVIPQLRLGFVTIGHIFSPEFEREKAIKIINTKCYINNNFYKQNKNKILFSKKAEKEMILQASQEISEIKSLHDRLENYYICAMDYEKLNEFSDKFIKKLLN